MNAAGLYHSFGLPTITGPEKAGFHDGRIGFRLSPLFVGLYPRLGVNGNPVCSVSIPLSDHPSNAFFLHPCAFFANGSSHVALITATCRTSVVEGPQSSFGYNGNITNPGAFAPTLLFHAVPSSRLFDHV